MLARSQIRCQKKVNLLVCKAGRRPYSSKTLYPPRFHTDFFEQLPLCTYPGILARVQPSSRDFIQVVERRVAVLLDEEDRRVGTVRIGSEWHDGRRPRVADHFQLGDGVVRKPHGIDVQIDDLAAVDAFAVQCWNSHVNGTLNPSAKR